MKERRIQSRQAQEFLFRLIFGVVAFFCFAVFFMITFHIVENAFEVMSWHFFTALPVPSGVPGGGLANAIWGSVLMVCMAVLMAVPLGLMLAVYLLEYGQNHFLGKMIQFFLNLWLGVPTLILGIFVFLIMVVRMGSFSGWAGAVSLALILFPVVARSAHDVLKLQPLALREAALALGISRWRVTLHILFKSSRSSLVSGALLGVARVSGETAALLFTALNSFYWPTNFNEPTANLQVTIFQYGLSASSDRLRQAWAAAFVLLVLVIVVLLLARMVLPNRES